MDFLKKHRKIIENVTGISFIITSAFLLKRATTISRYLFQNYRSFYQPALDLKYFIKNPGVQKHVTLTNLNCTPSPDLFKNHMEYIDREAIGSVKEFCFKEACKDFEAQMHYNGEKYDIFCDCSTFDPYVASPLLINNYDLLRRTAKKQKLSMITYGNMYYNKTSRKLQFQGHCFGTTKDQIEWVWGKIFQKNTFLLFVEGILLGFGICLCYNTIDIYENLFGESKELSEIIPEKN